MVDHQIAHIYCADETAREAAREVLLADPAISRVLVGSEIQHAGLAHWRTGELVALASPDAWFAYYWWTDPAKAPAFAGTVDIHRKPGYDPCELFFDPQRGCIPCEPALVKGSHGLVDELAPGDWATLAATCELPPAFSRPTVTDLPDLTKALMFGQA